MYIFKKKNPKIGPTSMVKTQWIRHLSILMIHCLRTISISVSKEARKKNQQNSQKWLPSQSFQQPYVWDILMFIPFLYHVITNVQITLNAKRAIWYLTSMYWHIVSANYFRSVSKPQAYINLMPTLNFISYMV